MSRQDLHSRGDDNLQSKADMLHNLQVQQIELEMQNQQLRDAQIELEEARNRYADLYDFSPVGYLTMDESAIVREINLTGAGMFGKERLNIVGQPFVNFLDTSSMQAFLAHLRQTFLVPGNSRLEVQIKVRGQKSRIVSLESLVTEMAGERMCRTVMTDVTEQRKLAVDLQVNRSAQDALLATIPALVFYLDSNFKFINVSQTFEDFVGLAPGVAAGKTFYDLFPRVMAEDFDRLAASVLQTGMAVYGFENSIHDESGTLVCLSTVLAPYRDFQGKAIGLVGVSIDISTIKSAANANSDLLLQNRKLTRSLFQAQEDERRHLARELHDELGQWLTAIQAEAQAISNIAQSDAVIRDSALAISKSAKEVHQVIRGMLRHLRPSLLDELGLADSLRELQQQWCRLHPDTVCEFKLDFALDGLGENLNVLIYRLVQEALTNIANHAHARHVTLTFDRESGNEEEGDFLLLKIADDGAGFDTQKIHQGLGLLGMRERMIAAGGDFYIDSMPGLGTNIMARLPLNPADRVTGGA